MPNIEQLQSIPVSEPETPPTPSFAARIDFVLGFLRRRYLIILLALVSALPVGALYLFTTPASYTASATMMIKSRKSPLQEALLGNAPLDASWIESQIGILRSQGIAAYVVKQLRLADDPKFTRPERGLFDRLLARLGWQGPSEPKSEAERAGEATAAVMQRARHPTYRSELYATN